MNPPDNGFDDHFQPIFMIMKSGGIPPKDACFQCYQPPVFYCTSATIGDLATWAGATISQVKKLVEFVCCFYGILTVAVCYLILRKLPLSEYSRLAAFGVVCFLPRHIYMSAMTSNDALSYLFAALSVYATLVAFERKLSPFSLGILSVILTVALFTKYTDFVVIPMVAAAFFSVLREPAMVSRKRAAVSLVAVLLLPLTVLGAYMISNTKHYGSPLPWNVGMYDPSLQRPRDPEPISYVTFKPWEEVGTPMLVPGKLHSFWTVVYGGMWFDTEPRFLRFLDSNRDWWIHYFDWYNGRGPFPGNNTSLPRVTTAVGSGLILLGLIPLALVLAGLGLCLSGKWRNLTGNSAAGRIGFSMMPVLAVFNAAGIVALTMRLPVYNSMKASYFLSSIPAFMVFLALGFMLCEKRKALRRVISVMLGLLFLLASLHIVRIVLAVRGA